MSIIFRNLPMLLLFLSLLLSQIAEATEKRKKVEKTYNISSKTEIYVDNKFGTVEFINWDKNELKLEVEIIVDARNEREAQEALDNIRIRINDSNPNSLLEFETDINNGRWNRGRNSYDFEINYRVNAPSGNDLDLRNRHGDIYLDDRSGKTRVDLSHGRIKAEQLTGDTDLELSFGDGSVQSVMKGRVEIKHFGRLVMDKSGDIEVESAHSNLRMGNGGVIYARVQHGDFEAENLVSFEADVQHSDIEVRGVEKMVSVDASHSDVEIDRIGENFERIEVEGGFSDFDLGISTKSKFELDARMSFGKLNYSSSAFSIPYVNKEMHNSRYKGSIGGGGSAKLYADLQHGDVRLNDY
ncbi:MAG: hypothetical protein AAF363_03280 [Bacteroidota bacterium]